MKKKKAAVEREALIQKIEKSAVEFRLQETTENCRELQQWLEDHVSLSPEGLAATLKKAKTAGDNRQVGQLVNQLIGNLKKGLAEYKPEEAVAILKVLIGTRRFDEVSRLADTFIASGAIADCAKSLTGRLLYAQALIDSGRIHPAILWLEDIKSKIEKTTKNKSDAKRLIEQSAECAGLLGRAYKQLYVDNAAQSTKQTELYLKQSLDSYGQVYFDSSFDDYDDRTWHAINLASVARRAEVAGSKVPNQRINSKRLANDVLKIIDGRRGTKHQLEWDDATAVEASLLIGNVDDAVKRTVEYCRKNTDPFKYASTLRQLNEVLQLDPDDEATGKILRLLRAMELSTEPDAAVDIVNPRHESTVVNDLIESPQFEAVFGDTEYKALKWYKRGLECADSVGKVSNNLGAAKGTGFLLRGGDLDPDLGNEPVLITNSHVVSDDPQEQNELVPRSVAPKDAVVVFHAVDPSKSYTFREQNAIHKNSHRNVHDYTILRFKPNNVPSDIPTLPIVKVHPPDDGKQRVYIIGHPKGGGLSFSIQDNRLTGYDPNTEAAKKVLYRAPTRGGSSGSPVFNEEWNVFALHSATKDDNNRGVLFSAIHDHVNSNG